jgi:hypothetical protein
MIRDGFEFLLPAYMSVIHMYLYGCIQSSLKHINTNLGHFKVASQPPFLEQLQIKWLLFLSPSGVEGRHLLFTKRIRREGSNYTPMYLDLVKDGTHNPPSSSHLANTQSAQPIFPITI